MKRWMKKMMAGFLSFVLILGSFAGTGVIAANATELEYPTTLTVQLISGGMPIVGEKIYLKNMEAVDDEGTLEFENITDENGIASYTWDVEDYWSVITDEDYEIQLGTDCEYEFEEPVRVCFNTYDNAICINDEPFTGEEPYELNVVRKGVSEEIDKSILKVNITAAGQPVKNMKMQFRDEQKNPLDIELPVTDENGLFSFDVSNMEDGTYLLRPALDSGYKGIGTSTEMRVKLEKDSNTKKTYVSKISVNGSMTEYTKEISFEVEKNAQPTISSVTADAFVSGRGGSVNVIVKGVNLTDSLYCRRFYVKSEIDSSKTPVDTEAVKYDNLQGNEKERTISVSLPAASEYPNAFAWKIGVGTTSSNISDESTTDFIHIVDATKADLEKAIEDAEKHTEANYTAESWKVYSDAIAKAKELLERSDATDAEYGAAIKQLEDAEAALEDAPDPIENRQTFKIKTVDNEGKAVSGLKFQLIFNGTGGKTHDFITDTEGFITVKAEDGLDGTYQLKLVADSEYTYDKPISIRFAKGKSTYIERVQIDNALYEQDEVTLEVVLNTATVITSMELEKTIVSNKGGTIKVSVNGRNLPDKLFYKLYYTKENDAQSYSSDVTGTVDAEGTNTLKTVSVALPEASGYADAVAWKIGLGAEESKISLATATDEIKIVSEASPEELETVIVKAKEKTSEKYTEESWKGYSAAISKAEKILANESATGLERGVAIMEIYEAEKKLVSIADLVKQTLKIKVVDKNRTPVKNVPLELKSFSHTIPVNPTDAEGKTTYIMNGTDEKNTNYELQPREGSGYTCETPTTVDFIVTSQSWYIQKVNGQEFTGQEIVLEMNTGVTEKGISEIVSSIVKISKDGGNTIITVKGTEIPEKLYYYVRAVKQRGEDIVYVPELAEAKGSAEERTFEINLPAVTEYPKTLGWIVSVSTEQQLSSEWTSLSAPIYVDDPVTQETKEIIEGLVAEAEKYNETDYTVKSWNAYEDVLREAVDLLQNEHATNTACLKIIDEIDKAKSELAEVAKKETKDALEESLASVETLNESDYTADSWKVYIDAVEAARKLVQDARAGDAECREALKVLETAKRGLVFAKEKDVVTDASKKALDAAIAEALKLWKADYTSSSWKAYNNAVETAKKLKTKKDATNTEYQSAIKDIQNAKKALKKAVQKVTLTTSSVYKKIALGKKLQLTAKVTPADAANKSVKWTSSNKKIATVNQKGKVTVTKSKKYVGKTVKITATAKDGSNKKAVYTLKVVKNSVKKISLKAKKTVKAGKKVTVKATVKTTGKNANKKLVWSVSNKKYASVNAKGVVTTKKAGKGKKITVTAKATDGSNKKASVKIKLKK